MTQHRCFISEWSCALPAVGHDVPVVALEGQLYPVFRVVDEVKHQYLLVHRQTHLKESRKSNNTLNSQDIKYQHETLKNNVDESKLEKLTVLSPWADRSSVFIIEKHISAGSPRSVAWLEKTPSLTDTVHFYTSRTNATIGARSSQLCHFWLLL